MWATIPCQNLHWHLQRCPSVTEIDYQARQHEIDFWLTPYEGDDDLSYDDATQTLVLSYVHTTLQYERNHAKTTGLDTTGIRPAMVGFPALAFADPQMPVPLSTDRLSIDAEGIVGNADGTFWISDEYGPYIYRFSADGNLIQTIQPVDAVLPYDSQGELSFTSEVDPATGRAGNQGFEGLSVDLENQILYAMLQSATIQDGGDQDTTSRYTRLFAYDVSNDIVERPALVGEWAVPLPISKSKGKTRASSEILFLGNGIFLALSRDGDGKGGDDLESSYKFVFAIDSKFAIHIDKPNSGRRTSSPLSMPPISMEANLTTPRIPSRLAGSLTIVSRRRNTSLS